MNRGFEHGIVTGLAGLTPRLSGDNSTWRGSPQTQLWHAGAGLAAVGLLFEYIALLRAAGPQRWAYDEMAAIGNMKFRFAEEEVTA